MSWTWVEKSAVTPESKNPRTFQLEIISCDFIAFPKGFFCTLNWNFICGFQSWIRWEWSNERGVWSTLFLLALPKPLTRFSKKICLNEINSRPLYGRYGTRLDSRPPSPSRFTFFFFASSLMSCTRNATSAVLTLLLLADFRLFLGQQVLD